MIHFRICFDCKVWQQVRGLKVPHRCEACDSDQVSILSIPDRLVVQKFSASYEQFTNELILRREVIHVQADPEKAP